MACYKCDDGRRRVAFYAEMASAPASIARRAGWRDQRADTGRLLAEYAEIEHA